MLEISNSIHGNEESLEQPKTREVCFVTWKINITHRRVSNQVMFLISIIELNHLVRPYLSDDGDGNYI